MKSKYIVIPILLLTILSVYSPIKVSGSNSVVKSKLKFNSKGTFKIVQFTDIHGGPFLEKETSNLISKILDFEKPDLVVITGDLIDGKCKTNRDIKDTIQSIASIMEEGSYPWCITFGNHDDEHKLLSKKEMMKIIMSYPYNLSQIGPKDIAGVGNYYLPIYNSKETNPIFNLYFLDSGNYAPKEVGGYNWIAFNQINWYRKVSTNLTKKNRTPIPALMFTHIALPEFKQLWETGKALGIRNEAECSPKINSGLFSSLLEMKDMKGVFVGHDHVNSYEGDYYGIKLGYCPGTGHNTYGRDGFPRGARVFLIREDDPAFFDTWVRTENDFVN
jgi:predicted phosphodiesterase